QGYGFWVRKPLFPRLALRLAGLRICRSGKALAATRQTNGTVHDNPFIHFPALSDLASNVRQISVGGRHLRCFDVVKFCVVF
ncbi:hypothetical protein ABLU57_06110, partial [Klebsiella sp. GG_Kp174]|uniref:hypothetical protein n=1 Tax=Klebsiella TaxID=570 RepID=UPI001B7D7EB1